MIFHKIRITYLLLFGLLSFTGEAQTDQGEKAIQKVFDVLRGREAVMADSAVPYLENGAWEALSYIEEKDTATKSMLMEAVPDYYRFRNGELLLKLINPENYNEYGVELTVGYKLDYTDIVLMDAKTGLEKDRWKLLYLDENYMALDMGELRVFFTHTPIQE